MIEGGVYDGNNDACPSSCTTSCHGDVDPLIGMIVAFDADEDPFINEKPLVLQQIPVTLKESSRCLHCNITILDRAPRLPKSHSRKEFITTKSTSSSDCSDVPISDTTSCLVVISRRGMQTHSSIISASTSPPRETKTANDVSPLVTCLSQ